jgi:hypothetical protein
VVCPTLYFIAAFPSHTNVLRVCTLHGRILALKQDPSHLHYKVTWPEQPLTPPSSADVQDDTESLLRNYFNLSLDLKSLYEHWSDVDPNFRKRAPEFAGVRILNQDAWETLLGFICSSNNNISRISQMVRLGSFDYFTCVSICLSACSVTALLLATSLLQVLIATGPQAVQVLRPTTRLCRRRGYARFPYAFVIDWTWCRVTS